MQQSPDFRSETVDEQIEQLFHTANSTPASHVVQDLQGLYERGDTPEQVRRSLDSIWSRLSDQLSPENRTLVALSDTDPLRALPSTRREQQARLPFEEQGQAVPGTERVQPGQHIHENQPEWNTLPARPLTRRSNPRRLRRVLALSTLAAIVLLSVFSWALVAHLNSQGNSRTGSGPGGGTPIPTVPVTPAPQSLHDQAHQLLNQYHQEMKNWGQTHLYQDPSTGKSYELDYAYDQQGLGSVLDGLVTQAKSSADYQEAIDQIQHALTNLHAMESNYSDQTPWNQVHSSDSHLLQHYKLTSGTVIVVSLLEQAMRIYQNGQLVKSFQVVTGRYELPSLPGSWQVEEHGGPTTLMSSEPKGSPFWYPPTLVHYLLRYHSGGYLIYDSWWRTVYGAGSNFPHHDPKSSTFMAQNGSNGGIDLPTNEMAWLYAHTQINTPVVIY